MRHGLERTTRVVVLLLVLPAVASARADGQQTFTGTWTRIEPPLTSDATHVEEIDHAEPVVEVRVRKSGQAGPFGYGYDMERTYRIGGPPETRTDPEGRIRTRSMNRDGGTLVIVTTTTEGANTETVREVWSLSDDGTRLTKTRQITDWRGTRDERNVFQKR